MTRSISRFAGVWLAVVALVCAFTTCETATAATISTWNVGSGQYQINFLFDSDPNFGGGGLLEIGQRAVYRQSAQLVPVAGNTYTALAGPQEAGVVGAPVSNPARNRWNFDYHIYYEGGVQNLDSLTMFITSPAGNSVTLPGGYDMLLANNDNVTGSVPWPGGDSQNPAFFIQDSQNPVFFPWFVSAFDMNVLGTYSFTLVAVEGSSTLSQTMYVNVVPTPGTMAGLAGMMILVTTGRRRRLVS